MVNPETDAFADVSAPRVKKAGSEASATLVNDGCGVAKKTEAETLLCSDASDAQPSKLKKSRKVANSFRDLGCY